jgi:hypothetical protein
VLNIVHKKKKEKKSPFLFIRGQQRAERLLMLANLALADGIHSEKPTFFCRHAVWMFLQIKNEQAERKPLVYHLAPIQQHQVCCVSIS